MQILYNNIVLGGKAKTMDDWEAEYESEVGISSLITFDEWLGGSAALEKLEH